MLPILTIVEENKHRIQPFLPNRDDHPGPGWRRTDPGKRMCAATRQPLDTGSLPGF